MLPALPVSRSGRGRGEAHRLIAGLASRWDLRLAWAAPSDLEAGYALGLAAGQAAEAPDPGVLAARCRRELDGGACAAAIVVDHPYTRPCLDVLKESRTPAILVLLSGQSPWRGAAAPAPSAVRSAERERLSRQACVAREIWSVGRGEACGLESSRSFHTVPSLDAAWMDRRLRRLISGPPDSGGRGGLTSIVIPCFNNLALTRRCLEAVAAHTPQRHEVVVVDDGSTDRTVDFVRRRTKARLVRLSENGGFVRAVNAGTTAARGRYVVWLNNDVVVTEGWLSSLIAHAESAPWIGAVGPCTNETVGMQKVEGAAYRSLDGLPAFAAAWSLRHQGRAVGVHRLTGFCLLMKREAIRRVGLLDERFGRGYYEEFDYCFRLRQAGYDLVCALDAFVHHDGRATFRDEQPRRVAVNRDLLIDKWCRQAVGFLDELDPVCARDHSR